METEAEAEVPALVVVAVTNPIVAVTNPIVSATKFKKRLRCFYLSLFFYRSDLQDGFPQAVLKQIIATTPGSLKPIGSPGVMVITQGS